MKTMKQIGFATAFALLLSFSATDASAAGIALDGAALTPAARTELTKEIARANAYMVNRSGGKLEEPKAPAAAASAASK